MPDSLNYLIRATDGAGQSNPSTGQVKTVSNDVEVQVSSIILASATAQHIVLPTITRSKIKAIFCEIKALDVPSSANPVDAVVLKFNSTSPGAGESWTMNLPFFNFLWDSTGPMANPIVSSLTTVTDIYATNLNATYNYQLDLRFILAP